jgi:hypothetical protein
MKLCTEVHAKKGKYNMRLTPRDEEIVRQISFDQHVIIQAVAYTAYVELTPNNKKPISQRDFHELFKDNWRVFADLVNESVEG